MNTIRYWLGGIRLYIAVFGLLLTGCVFWLVGTAYGGTSLFAIRLEEIFAWFAVAYVGLALSIGPFFKLFPMAPGRSLLFDARRLLGISAAWFSALHVAIAYGGQFNFANPVDLPGTYQRAFVLGLVAFLILAAMTATSFDAAFRSMGVWWFRLHRLVYIAALLILAHMFMIGVHATHTVPLIITSITAGLIIGMHVLIMVKIRVRSKWQLGTLGCMILAVVILVAYGFMQQAHGRMLTGQVGL